ncbi:Initiation factor 2 subunit family protein [Trichomonas vaginalis G3]|uniref:Translation initiation factor eIF2B subunit alpha n=1 Tax=Trichomonas vaginalis (strain ATCC PRA-98 / G3) TaxID=412133 RepID=A2D744_TRIV3|nr:translation initiation factor protein [Trichomonas vaginalis G3]EAY23561.1 Initiation factor 2 subunit family protein [Trichomonas vaginalis G3]KAI5490059.1 translation initiation factor protein [Trichomonas vaginalis G3]|eukprot:XP_001276809.1 Initiation factor 2 subunit family protein [Trichomonas vaginalis G3]
MSTNTNKYVELFRSLREKEKYGSIAIVVITVFSKVITESKSKTISGLVQEFNEVAKLIEDSFPDLPFQFKAAAQMYKAAIRSTKENDMSKWLSSFHANAQIQLDVARKALETIPYHVHPFLQHGMTIMTRGYDPLVLKCLSDRSDIQFHIFIAEGAPEKEGLLLANELARTTKHQITLIPDSAIGACMHTTNIVLIGTEIVLDDGSLLAPVGTYTMAALASISRRPVYCVCDSFRFYRYEDFILNPNDLGDLQRKVKYQPEGTFDENIRFYNDKYDLTPAKYVQMLVTEKGPLPTSDVTHELTKLLGFKTFKND